MISLRIIIPAIFLFSFWGISQAQNTINEQDLIERIIENIAEQEEENRDYTNLLEEISHLIQNPININTANAQDLEQLYLLNKSQIAQLLTYREENGEILSIYELQLIKGFSLELIRDIAPMVFTKTVRKDSQKKLIRQLLLLRSDYSFEKELGYKSQNMNSRFQGEPWKYYMRYQAESSKPGINFGFTAENDKGESFFKNQNANGFDFYTVHFQKKSRDFLQQINLGDYHIKFGQGISLWSGIGSKKSSFTTQNARKYQGIKAYKSSDENRFFRGISLILSPLKGFEIATFVSMHKIDASASADTVSSFVSSIVNTGLHRNRNELKQEDALRQTLLGGYLMWDIKNLELGFSYFQYSFSPEIKFDEKPYSQHYFSGKSNYNCSFTYQSQFNNIHLYGEIAQSKSGGLGILQGANIQIHPQLQLEAIYRRYDKNYHAHFSNAFSEQSRNQNEEGLYFGINFHPFPKWTLKAYYDQFEFPWLRFSGSAPGNGHDYFAQLGYTKSEKLSLYFRYKQENKSDNVNSKYINTPLEFEKNQYRLHLSAQVATHWEIRNRIEFSHYKHAEQHENGFLIYQDVIYRFSRLPLQFSLRFAIFDTDSYDTRIYAYESDILYAYSVPAYYKQGSRFYFNMHYKISKNFTFYARYAQSKYANTESIGSGTSLIQGNTKSDFKLLLQFRF